MGKSKLELKFKHGLLLGTTLTVLVMSAIMDTYFVSKTIFNLETVYLDGKTYKIIKKGK
jgi:HrpA-like RNA helicase